MSPQVVGKRYLAVGVFAYNYCGQARPHADGTTLQFDLRTGEVFDIGDWVDRSSLTQSLRKGKLRRTLMLGGYGQDCVDWFDSDGWNNALLSLTPNGLVVSPRTFSRPDLISCVDSFVFDFQRIKPLVKPEFKRRMAEMINDVSTAQTNDTDDLGGTPLPLPKSKP